MVQPIDYTVPMQNPLAAFEQAANFGMGIQQNQQALEANRLKIEAEKAGQERLRQVGELVMKAASPDATIDDMRAVMMTAASPEQLKAYESKLSAMTTEQKKAEFTPALQVKYALNSGKPDLAKKILMDRATALENSGDGAGAQRARALAETIDDDGGVTVSADIASKLAFDSEIGAPALKAMQEELLFKGKLAEGEAKAKTAGVEAAYAESKAIADLAQSEANIKNINDQIRDRSRRFGLDSQRFQADVADRARNYQLNYAKAFGDMAKLPEATQKLVNDKTIAAVGKETLGQGYLDLAGRIEKSNLSGGLFSSATQAIKGLGGSPDQLRLEFARIKNSGVLASLPPGPATDKDVLLASRGFPKDNANKKEIASFLRGMAKLQMVQAAGDTAQAEWISSNGSLGKARGGMNVGGQTVQPGTSFIDFNKRFVADAAKKATAATAAPPPAAKAKAAPATAGDAALLAKYGVK